MVEILDKSQEIGRMDVMGQVRQKLRFRINPTPGPSAVQVFYCCIDKQDTIGFVQLFNQISRKLMQCQEAHLFFVL